MFRLAWPNWAFNCLLMLRLTLPLPLLQNLRLILLHSQFNSHLWPKACWTNLQKDSTVMN
jgi:hypothetical protein